MKFPDILVVVVTVLSGILCVGVATGGKRPPENLAYKIPIDVIDIMRKHGFPVVHDKPATNKWFGFSHGTDQWLGGRPSFGLMFYEASLIPIPVRLEIVEYCVRLHEAQRRNITIKIRMMNDTFERQLFKPRAFFEMILHRIKR